MQILLLSLLLTLTSPTHAADDLTKGALILKDVIPINIEIAKTPEQQAKGLMFRTQMGEKEGMLFEYNTPQQPLSFWMKNTYIPLDILFINEQKEIIHIAKNTTPRSTVPILSPQPTQYVLELNAGSADKWEIKKGDRIKYHEIQ